VVLIYMRLTAATVLLLTYYKGDVKEDPGIEEEVLEVL
jgi:hypothetical protein